MKNKFLCLIICMALVFSCVLCNAVSVDEVNGQDEGLTVKDVGHGEFQLDDSTLNSKSVVNDVKVKIKKVKENIYDITDKSILIQDKDYDKLLKVKDNTFLRVKELKVNIKNQKELNDAITNYNVNPTMAEDLRKISERAKQKDSGISSEIIIYTPKKANTLSTKLSMKSNQLNNLNNTELRLNVLPSLTKLGLTKQSYNYYVYNGEQMLDELYYGYQNTPMTTIKTGTTVFNSYFKTVLNNVGSYASGFALDKILGGPYSLVTVFKPEFSSVSPNQNDYWQASLAESKYKRYTSIGSYDSNLRIWFFNLKAMGGTGTMHFDHRLYSYAQNKVINKSDPTVSFRSPNYDRLYVKALEYKYSQLIYNESQKGWKPTPQNTSLTVSTTFVSLN